MQKKISNTALSIAILLLGVGALTTMVWLSPSQAPQADRNAMPETQNAPVQANHASAAVSSPGADPFAERLRNPLAADAAPVAGSTPVPAIPAGVDPFKEKQAQQIQQATASPFGASPSKP